MRISSTVLFVTLLCTMTPLLADELKPIEVKASSFKNKSPNDLAQSVTVISDEKLDKERNSSIGETLDSELGVSSTSFGPGASRPIIRGLGGNRVKVLENGIDSLDASRVSEDHAVSIEPYAADQIEILRGPSTLRFGSGAVGGVVNIVNSRLLSEVPAAPLVLDLDYEHAYVSDGNTVGAKLNGGAGSFAWHVDGLHRKTNDYEIDGFANEEEPDNRGTLENSDIDDTNSFGVGGAFINESIVLGLAYGKFDTNYGIPGAEEGDIRIDMDQDRWDFDGKLIKPIAGIEQISLRSGYNDYEHDEVEPSGEVATTFENEEWDNRLELLTSIANWSTVFGLSYNDRKFSAVGEEAFIAPVDSDSYGFFTVAQREFGKWNLELGGRVETVDFDPDNQSSEDSDVYSLSAAIIRTITNQIDLKLNLGRSQRAPEIVELFAAGPHLATLTFERGDANLDEETWYTFEVGVSGKQQEINWQVNTYYNRVNDYIFLQFADNNADGVADRVDEEGNPAGELLLGDYVNEDAEFYGIEAELASRLIDSQAGKLDGRVFFDQVRGELRGSGGYLPRIPPRRLGFGLDYSKGPWAADAELIFFDEQERTADLETDTDSYTMLNVGAAYAFTVAKTDAKIFLRGENLLDEDARRHSSFIKNVAPLPGIGAKLGLAINY